MTTTTDNTRTVFAIALILAISLAQAAWAGDKVYTLAYDGFNTGGGAGTYPVHSRPWGAAPTLNVVGFDETRPWDVSTSVVYMRPGKTRQLKHSLVSGTQPGSMGHWVFNGPRTLRRDLPMAPVAKSGTYTLCLLICTWDNKKFNNKPDCNGHTTGNKDTYGMIGFTPDNPGIWRKASDAKYGNNGAKGLSVGYKADNLAVFAGGQQLIVLEKYKEDTTYLLMAEMTVSAKGPEYVKGFYAADGDKKLTPAKFNAENDGKGAKVESWSSPKDMIELELYMNDYGNWIPGKQHLRPDNYPMASWADRAKTDYISWDEVRLLDGKATVPVPNDQGDPEMVKLAKERKRLLTAKKTLEPKLVAYWALDEGTGKVAKDAVGGLEGKLLRAKWTKDGFLGSAMNFTAKQGPKYGPHFGSVVSVPHTAVVDTMLPWERYHPLTYTAWVRGGEDFKHIADIITKCGGARAPERSFADIKGIGFMVINNTLEFELTNSINFPQKDNRLKVRSKLPVPGDGKWHHVAVTYNGNSKATGVTFYIDGVKDGPVAVVQDMLTADIGTLDPYCIGGRALKTEKDGPSAGGCGYNMVGDIDEVGVFSYVLQPGHVIAIHSLATDLKLPLDKVNEVIELHRAKKGSAKVGGKTWEYATGLKGDLGKVVKSDAGISVKLADDGSGVTTK